MIVVRWTKGSGKFILISWQFSFQWISIYSCNVGDRISILNTLKIPLNMHNESFEMSHTWYKDSSTSSRGLQGLQWLTGLIAFKSLLATEMEPSAVSENLIKAVWLGSGSISLVLFVNLLSVSDFAINPTFAWSKSAFQARHRKSLVRARAQCFDLRASESEARTDS